MLWIVEVTGRQRKGGFGTLMTPIILFDHTVTLFVKYLMNTQTRLEHIAPMTDGLEVLRRGVGIHPVVGGTASVPSTLN